MNMFVQDYERAGSNMVKANLESDRLSIVSQISNLLSDMDKSDEKNMLFLESLTHAFQDTQKKLRTVKKFERVMGSVLGHDGR